MNGFASARMPSQPFVVALIGALLLLSVLAAASPVLPVVAVALLASFFLAPVRRRLEARGLPRSVAAGITVSCLVGVVVVGVLIILAIVVDQGGALARQLPTYVEQIRTRYVDGTLPGWLVDVCSAAATALTGALATGGAAQIGLGAVWALLGLVGLALELALLPLLIFLLLKDQDDMARIQSRIPAPWRPDLLEIIDIVSRNLLRYFRSILVVGSIVGVIITLGLVVIGLVVPGGEILVRFALILGLIALVMETVPQIGQIISYVPALLVALTAGWEATVAVSVFYFITFNIEGAYLTPTFQGRIVNFGGATVLALIGIGFAVAGLLGAIVALPVAGIVRDSFSLLFTRAQAMAGVPPAPVPEAGSPALDEPRVGA